jgi:hypothetical protein
MKCKNSIREVLGLGKDNKSKRKTMAEASVLSLSKGASFNKQVPPTMGVPSDDKKEIKEGDKEEVKCEGKGNDGDDNKSSDIFNADAGSYYNQKGMIGLQSTGGGDPTFDGGVIMNTPNFLTPCTSLHPSNHLAH